MVVDSCEARSKELGDWNGSRCERIGRTRSWSSRRPRTSDHISRAVTKLLGGGGIFQARNPCPGHKRDPQALDALDELGIDFVEDTLIRARIIQRQPVHCSAAVLPGG